MQSPFGTQHPLFYPVLMIAGAAAAAASAGMQMAANEQSKAAMRNVVDSELARQRGYQREAAAIAQASQAQSTPQAAGQQIAEGAQKRTQAYKEVGAQQLGQGTPQDKAVSKEQQTGARMQMASSDAERAANLGWSDWLHNQMVKDIMAQRRLSVLQRLSRESGDVMQYEMQDAQQAGGSLRGAAGVVGGLGQVAGAAGAAGYGPQLGGGTSTTSLGIDSNPDYYNQFAGQV